MNGGDDKWTNEQHNNEKATVVARLPARVVDQVVRDDRAARPAVIE